MSYPKNPTNLREAAMTLAEFAKTAPGRLPERVRIAIEIAESSGEMDESESSGSRPHRYRE